jgi:hypothetical protein
MTQPLNTCRTVTGRLVEIDVASGYRTVGDVDGMIAMLAKAPSMAPRGEQLVIVADWRMCHTFTPSVAARALEMLTAPHMQHVERSAILHRAAAATSVMQVFRLVREAGFPYRRAFTDPVELAAWLGEVLDDAERGRLRAFLSQRA